MPEGDPSDTAALRGAGVVHATTCSTRRWPSSPAPGVSVWGSRELPGARPHDAASGAPRPVNLLTLDGEQYLVAARGHTQWVRNLRVAGTGELRVGKRTDRFRATEVADADKVADPARLPEAVEGRGRRVLRRRERRLLRRRPPPHRARPPGRSGSHPARVVRTRRCAGAASWCVASGDRAGTRSGRHR